MNISNITHATNSQRVRRGIVAAGTLLIVSAAALGLAHRPSRDPVFDSWPATKMSSGVSAARLRYADFKLRQVEQREGNWVNAPSAAPLR